jgi:glycine/D-amino acid oxidase-like deaminating enzyme
MATVDPTRVRSRSFWLETCDDDLTARPGPSGDLSVDVAIVGGGLTGLWTALEIRSRAPDCRIAVLEAEVCGFGASGRNGGWCSALFPASLDQLARLAGRDAAVAQYRAMIDTVTHVGRTLDDLGIDCHWAHGGTLTMATNPAHIDRVRDHVVEQHRWGFGNEDDRWLSPSETAERVRPHGNVGSAYTPHCAAVHPARMVRGLAHAAEDAGVAVHEGTRVTRIDPGVVTTDHGVVRAETVLRCTEGYTPGLPGHARDVIPLYSMMIATEPLPPAVWEQVGLQRRETFTDGRHLLIYGQRTADDRFAFGGRGAPYHFGSAVKDRYDRDQRVADDLTRVLAELFPASRGARITHHWGGPLAVPRDWTASVVLDRATGLGWAGGYVGDGVATTNLAGRTLADLVLGRDSELTRLPWVGHRGRDWEPEPLRWVGINAGRSVAAVADRREARTRRPATAMERVMALFTGGH